jgi:uncharacterized protein (TIGR02466 family)
MNMFNLFPTPVAFSKFERELTEEELAFFKNQEQKPNQGNTTSANRKILEHALMVDVCAAIQKAIDTYFQEVYRPKFDVKLRITQSWMNYSEPGQFHHKHAHPNSFLSGCFYPQADKELDKLYFFNEPYHRIKIHSEDFNVYNSDSWWLPVGTGDIVIFPSSLTHMVEKVEAKETRISLSFNTFPVGYVGNDDSLTGLHL